MPVLLFLGCCAAVSAVSIRLMQLEQRRRMVEIYVNASEFAEPRQYLPFSRGTSMYEAKPFAQVIPRPISIGDGSTGSLSPIIEGRHT